MGNGTPAYRLWKIGTHRQLGILSGPSKYDPDYPLFGRDLDNEAPEFPANVFRGLWNPAEPKWGNAIFADFEVCPLEPEKLGAMQAVCIESAKNIVVQR
jgi:hypothetical protein